MPKRRARAETGEAAAQEPKNQKVTARFSDEEYAQLERLSKERGEKLSSLLRGLVLDTIEEVKRGL